MSGRKNTLLKFQLVNDGDIADDITGPVTSIRFMDNIGIQVNLDSTDAVGTAYVQVSADYEEDTLGNVLNAGNWISVTSQAYTAGAPDYTYFDLNQLSAPWVRLFYDATSGTGAIDAFITGKQL